MHQHAGTAAAVRLKTTPDHQSKPTVDGDSTIHTDALIQTLHRLVKADLTAAGYRVALDTILRLASQGRVTECVGTQWLADRLGLHRNAVGQAYQALEQAGILRRIPVPKRGAPTRTTLVGPAETLIRRQSGVALHGALGIELTNFVYRAGTPEPRPQPHCKPSITVKGPNGSEPVVAAEPPKEKARVDPQAQMDQAKRIPPAAREAAMAFKGKPQDLPINSNWNLTQEDIVFLRRLVPEPSQDQHRHNSSPRVVPLAEQAPAPIANALWHALPRITKLTGCAKRAGEVLDEIAFTVCQGKLGNGDALGGVRAAISLVEKGRWQLPKGFTGNWRGAVLRGLQLPRRECDARNFVH
jgi:hypothetical protein